MSKVTIIGAALYPQRVAPWYQEAWNDPQVARFMSVGPYQTLAEPDTSTWTRVFLMDDQDLGLAVIHADRGDTAGSFSCWVLSRATPQEKKRVAGSLIQFAFDYAHRALALRYLGWTTHETNVECRAFSDRKAKQWGVQEDSAWDPHLGRYVGQHHYKIKLPYGGL